MGAGKVVPHGWEGEANVHLLTDAQCRECILGYPDRKSLMWNVRKVEDKTKHPNEY
jgi:formate dehydrogenase (coenzyme F420) alpha subunit